MSDSSLHWNLGFSYLSCTIHPMVVFGIIDHYLRRAEHQDRVIGALLGVNNDGVIEVRDSFPIPHVETDGLPSLNVDYFASMCDLHYRASPNEVVVGWYATGASLNENTSRIHEYIWEEMHAPPVHLLVDTELTDNMLSTKAFLSSPVSFDDGKHLGVAQFQPLMVTFPEFDRDSGADVVLKRAKRGSETSYLSDLSTFEVALARLASLLDRVGDYVEDVLAERKEGDAGIGRAIANIVSSFPKISLDNFEKMYNDSVQDLVMVMYLAGLTETQLVVSEKLDSTPL